MANAYKPVLALLITAFSSMWIGHSLIASTDDNRCNANQQSGVLAVPDIDDSAFVAKLQQQIQQLQNENGQLQQQLHAQAITPLPTNQTEQPSLGSSSSNQLLRDQLHALEIEKQQRKANDFGNWLMKSQSANSQFNLNDELAHRFEQEARDPIWAEQEENRYQQLFNTQDEFREFALRDAQCRNTQCEITVSTANSEQSYLLLQAINNALQDTEVLVATDEQRGISKLYINSDKKGFEFN